MKLLDKALDFIETYINGIFMLVMCLIIFLQVLFRRLDMPLDWTEEIARFLFIWIIYISTSKAIKARRHLSIDILPLFLNEKGKMALRLISDVFGLIFFLIVFYYGMQVIGGFFARPQYSQATHTNMIFGYAGPYTGAACAVLRYIQDILLTIQELRGKSNGTEEVAA